MKNMKWFSLTKIWRTNYLAILTVTGVICGLVLGMSLHTREKPWTRREAMYVSFIGQLFLQMLKCVIIPVVIPSLIASVGSLHFKLCRNVGLRAVAYYFLTTVIAVTCGILLVVSISPGSSVSRQTSEESNDTSTRRNVTTVDTLMDLVRNCFPPNIIGATIEKYRTEIVYPGTDGNFTDFKTKELIDGADKYTWKFQPQWSGGTNIIGLVVFSVMTGLAIAAAEEEGRPFLQLFTSISAVMMKVTNWIIHLAPIGVCFLIAGQVLETKNYNEMFKKLGFYFGTVILGLFIHGFIILPTIYAIATRSLPFKFIMNMSNAIFTAFGTASSSATLPITIENLENNNGIDSRISRFVLPIGATINMDGTALYEAVAAIFIAQLRNIPLGPIEVISISITATAASIGAAGIPQAGLVTMIMVLDSVGLPSDDIAMIYSVDWLLDRFRTAINVLGDAIGAGIVNHYSIKELETLKEDNTKEELAKKYGSKSIEVESTSM